MYSEKKVVWVENDAFPEKFDALVNPEDLVLGVIPEVEAVLVSSDESDFPDFADFFDFSDLLLDLIESVMDLFLTIFYSGVYSDV
ncbi:MAG: hypothetical protein EZS28_042034 [Streblomastix strix]|uniref:Uncharacterized protein n=1 Tax=Streblomastix strix TaxID=222440 RepID=A0A5J4TX27_9EUKA|nr:MAG: hypothetical protein EZS28_042034 [Streblomastix strix]